MKDNQTFEKQLINFDEMEFKRQTQNFNQNLDILNQIVELYEGLFAGKMTPERIKEILGGNYESLKEAARQAVRKDVKNQVLSEIALQRIEERIEEFEAKASQLVKRFNQSGLRAFPVVIPVDWFGINPEGRFYIPDETIAKIKERCSNYISCPEELELHEALQQVATGYTRFLAGWGQCTRDGMPAYVSIEHYLSIENGIVTLCLNNDYSQLIR